MSKKVIISSGLILILMFVSAGFTQAQSAATKKAATKSWNSFWTKFSTAVKNKDRKTFIALTRKDFQDAGGGTLKEWLDSTSWSRLRNSVNKGTKDYSHGKEIGRITKNKDLIFVYGKNGWRFFGELVA
ncbi:MAG TPA: hypothetical protein PKY82_07595 [Pyrinomonadaceae bacterium]|nr:hypothetical protein [Pyrinomonadaceae bacterium]